MDEVKRHTERDQASSFTQNINLEPQPDILLISRTFLAQFHQIFEGPLLELKAINSSWRGEVSIVIFLREKPFRQ